MDTNLNDLFEKFNSEARCREYIGRLRWPNRISCVRCGNISISRLAKRPQFQCNKCDYQFSVTAGTVLHDSHLPLWKWLLAIFLICDSTKGMSANQLHLALHVSYKTAWHLYHRIREAMKTDISEKLKGIIEAGETFVGSRFDSQRSRQLREKSGILYTNSFDNIWSLFKRGVTSSFHKVSEKHIDRYLDEFVYRLNSRDNAALFPRTVQRLVASKRLTFRKLIGMTIEKTRADRKDGSAVSRVRGKVRKRNRSKNIGGKLLVSRDK